MKRFVWVLIFVASVLFCPLLTFGVDHLWMQNLALRMGVFVAFTIIGGLALRAASRASGIPQIAFFLSAALVQACVYLAASFLADISTLPFTMNWSEASRYYYASLFFAQRIYDVWAPPTVLHPSRYLMLAVPFLISNSPIWLHRAWQVLLWLVMPALTAFFLARRAGKLSGLHSNPSTYQRLNLLLAAAAIFLYLFVGDVYYHLLVPVVIVLWVFVSAQPGLQASAGASRGLRMALRILAVLLASAWAGISRINWFPVPAMLAATLILLEEPLAGKPGQVGVQGEAFSRPGHSSGLARHPVVLYVLRIAAWGLFGMAVALTSQAAYVIWSKNSAQQFASSFTSDLLWSRLLPNPTYAPGILLAVSIVSLPLLLVGASRLLERQQGVAYWRRLHPLRLLGLAGMLAALFAVGLVVSVKIGGGNNIHNMDAYLIFLLVVVTYFYVGAAWPDRPAVRDDAPNEVEASSLPAGAEIASLQQVAPYVLTPQAGATRVLAAAAALFPVIWTVAFTAPQPPPPDPAAVQEELQTIAEFSQAAHRQGGEVLFISERQLLTFGYIPDVRLIPEYERMFLMEAAMSGDPAYLGELYDDLKSHRFALIVSEPLSRQQKGASEVFGAENDVWVRRVAAPILCYYMPVKTLRTVRIQLLAPRPEKLDDCP